MGQSGKAKRGRELPAETDPLLRLEPTPSGWYIDSMATKSKHAHKPLCHYMGANIPMRVIRVYARQIAKRFQPDRIILFGSYACGTPHEDSDVDLLVVMPCRN